MANIDSSSTGAVGRLIMDAKEFNPNDAQGLDKAEQQSIGMRLEWMYHTARAIHDLTGAMISGEVEKSTESILWAIQELSRGQCRDLEGMSERLQDVALGYYAEHFAKHATA